MIKASIVLGHEVIGKVTHNDSLELHEGQMVAINPSKPCGHCKYCIEYNENQCTEMHSFGSAIYFSHVDGGFTRHKMVETLQCAPYPAKADEKAMASAKPLVVAIHAVHQAGELQGKRVLISGAGPIGCLVVSAVKTLGAAEIVCADVGPRSLSLGKEMGANVLVNPQNDDADHRKAEKGHFDVSFGVSSYPSLVSTCLEATRTRDVMAQVGMGGAMAEFSMITLIGKEISFKSSFRFTSELNTVASWPADGVINPLFLLSAKYPFTDLEEALRFADDKTQAAKVRPIF